jgi:hypothetical protein
MRRLGEKANAGAMRISGDVLEMKSKDNIKMDVKELK